MSFGKILLFPLCLMPIMQVFKFFYFYFLANRSGDKEEFRLINYMIIFFSSCFSELLYVCLVTANLTNI